MGRRLDNSKCLNRKTNNLKWINRTYLRLEKVKKNRASKDFMNISNLLKKRKLKRNKRIVILVLNYKELSLDLISINCLQAFSLMERKKSRNKEMRIKIQFHHLKI